MNDPSTKVAFKYEGIRVETSWFKTPMAARSWAKENVHGDYELKSPKEE